MYEFTSKHATDVFRYMHPKEKYLFSFDSYAGKIFISLNSLRHSLNRNNGLQHVGENTLYDRVCPRPHTCTCHPLRRYGVHVSTNHVHVQQMNVM